MKIHRKLVVCLFAFAMMLSACSTTSTAQITDNGDAVLKNTNFDSLESRTKKKVASMVETVYSTDYSNAVKENIDNLKNKKDYTEDDMLIIHDPYGTNNLSLYVYFKTDKDVQVSYTIQANDTSDFNETVEKSTKKTHEFTVIGLIPNTTNTITFTLTDVIGKKTTKTVKYKMGKKLGVEETNLQVTANNETQSLSNGLYAILGNDSDDQDFVYYYDNNRTLRGETPIVGYRAHRLLFRNGLMYYSISETKIAAVNSLRQVKKIIHTGNYELHHDYCFDDDGNLLVLGSKEGDSYSDSNSEDLILRIDPDKDKILQVIDLGEILGDYKATTHKGSTTNQEGVLGLDWMHINALQWLGNNTVILSSRETSSILKISNLFGDSPNIDYIIGQQNFWDATYGDKVLTQVGTFPNTGGQHSVTIEYDDSLPDGQYYLYMFNNNYGVSATQDYDWTQIDGIYTTSMSQMTTEEIANASSYYYKYLVDENAGTYELVKSFAVPYSSFISSVQEIGDTIVVDSGGQGIFGEYTQDETLLKQFKMKMNKYMIYRVYKYDFDGFYFNK
ncbi:aryl-sulfate sulfotransferase [Absicoccus porci]|uniref:aryl-sulfate sulfotransferase n=1 Tax=Absicoccus porci TaxID=2486576 RepID=UPI002941E177|nr:aryl-sulfate sulfotransferase [Absicoccus porci]